jgi:uncharacterized protein involved in response to NO
MAAMRRTRPPFAYVWFFPAAALYGAVAAALWVWGIAGSGGTLPGLATPAGHAHEMLFGYALAVVAGFLLGPRPLPVTVSLLTAWGLARLSFLLWPGSWAATVAAAVFAGGFALGVIPRFARSARKWRNRSVVVIVAGLAVVSVAAARFAAAPPLRSLMLAALVLLCALMFFMGGRVIAPAVAGHVVRAGGRLEARVQPLLEGGGLLCFAAALAALAFSREGARVSGALLISAGLLTALRLARWRLWLCLGRPDLLILGLGYGWLAAGLAVVGVSALTAAPELTRNLHMLTIGALGTLTVAVMARTRLLQRYRDANASAAAHMAALLMSGAALARVAGGWDTGSIWMLVSATLWCTACLVLAAVLIAAGRVRAVR